MGKICICTSTLDPKFTEVDPEKLRRIREGWINGNKENVSGSTDKVLHSGGIALDGLL